MAPHNPTLRNKTNMSKEPLELQIIIDNIVADLATMYETDESSFTDNQELYGHIIRYAQDIITYDDLIEYCEDLYETPGLLQLDEDSF